MKPRRDLAAIRECGCVAIIMVVESERYTASANDMATFYKDVHRATTRKRKPIKLTVVEFRDNQKWNMRCPVCDPRLALEASK